jgi:tRNA1Val (adenine37-N6)-methyltransferase
MEGAAWQSEGETLEPLTASVSVLVSPQHTFNTDTLLLAWYAAPRHRDSCADFGTGCGTIPLLWQSRFAPAHITAVELQENAYSMARRSVELNGFTGSITVLQRDLRELSPQREPWMGNLDVVACNPPYQEWGTGLVNVDDSRRLARHAATCTMDDVCRAANAALKYGGKLFLCQRPQRLCDAMDAMRRAGLEPKRLRLVQQRPDKPPSLFLLEGKKGARPGLRVEPVLFIEQEGGAFSPEMLEVYGEYKRHGRTGRKGGAG